MAEKADDFDPVAIHNAGSYGSEFEDYDSEAERQKGQRADLFSKEKKKSQGVASKHEVTAEYSKEEGRNQRFHILSLDAYNRHKKMVNDYLLYYGGSRAQFKRDSSRDKRDIDVIQEHHQFLWEDDEEPEDSWEKRLAKKYYDKLFKEYCITDLSRYKENKIALRWRIEKEVIEGKGQFICGNKKCSEKEGLRSWEVNFGYVEHDEKKNALVKLRLCPDCSYKLNYHHKKKEVKKKRKMNMSTEQLSKKQRLDAEEGEGQRENPEPNEGSSDVSAERGVPADSDENAVWKGPAIIQEDKTREEEFEDYFEDMFL